MKKLAIEQDLIGWEHFMEGVISKQFYVIQLEHISRTAGHLNGRDWVKKFISQILQITHSQWVYRNVTLHDKAGGSLRKRNMERMKCEAEALACMNPLQLPVESRFLLEMVEIGM
mgnify:FL=1